MQTHPILITFCSVLYYKRLFDKKEEIEQYDLIRIHQKKTKSDQISPEYQIQIQSNDIKPKQVYNHKIVNRWQVALTLIHNSGLIIYRKKTVSYRKFIITIVNNENNIN